MPNAYYVGDTLNALGDIARAQKHDSLATKLYREALVTLRQQDIQAGIPSVLHNLGQMALRQRDLAEAKRCFLEALQSFSDRGDQRGVAECIVGMAGVLCGLERYGDAAQALGAAAGVFRSSNTSTWPSNRTDSERIAGEVRGRLDPATFANSSNRGQALPVADTLTWLESSFRTGKPTARGPLSLISGREREVAVLVAQGLTNREIAERLFIAEGTAGLHVKHILAKLDFASRAQIAAWAVEHHLV